MGSAKVNEGAKGRQAPRETTKDGGDSPAGSTQHLSEPKGNFFIKTWMKRMGRTQEKSPKLEARKITSSKTGLRAKKRGG